MWPVTAQSEVLIDDNEWTDALSVENGGAAIVEVDFQNVADGGEWLAIEFNAADDCFVCGGVGGDLGNSGMLYWDALDEDGNFPSAAAEKVSQMKWPLLFRFLIRTCVDRKVRESYSALISSEPCQSRKRVGKSTLILHKELPTRLY